MIPSVHSQIQLLTQLEADLTNATRIAAQSIQPPFTPRQRLAIQTAFAPCLQLHSKINLILNPLLWSPDLRDLRHTDPIRRCLDGITRRLTHWNTTYRLLTRVIRAPKIPLPTLQPAADSPIARQLLAFDTLLYRLHYQLGPVQNKNALLAGHHDDIPMAFTRFLQLAQFARRLALAVGGAAPLSFLDVGCGIGLKIAGAAQFFEIARGFDYDKSRLPIAKRLAHHPDRPDDRAFHADGLTFDGYGNYDVIYAYQPMADEARQIQMDRHIAATCRPGTVLIMPHVQFQYRHADYGCHPVTGPVYLAGCDERHAKPILRRLAHIGHIVPKPTAQRCRDESLATPLCNALRRVGHLE